MNDNLIIFNDHRLLKFEAAREGLTYSDYRTKLKLHGIPLEIAVENVKSGISIKEYVEYRFRVENRIKLSIGSMIAASVIGLCTALTMYHIPSRYEQALREYEKAKIVYELKGEIIGEEKSLERAVKHLEEEEILTFGFSRT